MKKENKTEYIIYTNICIIVLIIGVLISTILYKYILYKTKEQNLFQTGNNLKELYNTNKIEEATIKEKYSGKKKDIDSITSDWELLLVNKENKIPEGYIIELEEIDNNYKVDKRIANALNLMLEDAKKEGLSPLVCSSYRTNEKQEQLYNSKVQEYKQLGCTYEEAQEFASYWVAIPGTGEHETGLAIDIVSEDYQILDEKQEETNEQKWLIENSYKYGFVLRYPTDKKAITMINYEPWHYRYVGIENAKYMKEHDMCLEEYIIYLKQFEEEEYKENIID